MFAPGLVLSLTYQTWNAPKISIPHTALNTRLLYLYMIIKAAYTPYLQPQTPPCDGVFAYITELLLEALKFY